MHRKFITLIVAAAVAVTGLTAPARADGQDVARALAGVAALAIIGKIIHDSNKDDHVVTHQAQPNYNYTRPRHETHIHNYNKQKPVRPNFSRYDLPRHCLRDYRVNRQHVRLFGANCLRKNYKYSGSLPYACQFQFNNRHGSHTGYEPLCLRERGYRTARY